MKLAAAPALVAAALAGLFAGLVAPPTLAEPDTLARLASGRLIADRGGLPPSNDPRAAGATRRWSNPEWLGDLALFAAQRLGGDGALTLLVVLLAALGAALLVLAASGPLAAPSPSSLDAWRRALSALTVALLALPALAARLAARNEVHLLWLAGATMLLAGRTRGAPPSDTRDAAEPRSGAGHAPRWPLLALALLAVLWANLHGSFVVGLTIVVASALGARGRARRRLLLLAAAHPLLWLASPHGLGVYGQLLEHLRDATTLRAQIVEWRPGASVPTMAWALALAAAATLAAMGASWRDVGARRELLARGALLLAAVGAALLSRRLVLLVFVYAVWAAPLFDLAIAREGVRSEGRGRQLLRRVLLGAALASALFLTFAARRYARPALARHRPAPPATVLSALDRLAALDALVPYNSAPWVLWRCPRARLVADPRNVGGALGLRAYRSLLTRPQQLGEIRWRQVGAVLVDRGLASWRAMGAYLGADAGWRRVLDAGRFRLYVRRSAAAPR